MMDLRSAARMLGGEVSGRGILCPGPGHSSRDRSLSVLFSASAPGGFIVRSHAGDDDLTAKDYVRQRLGLEPAFDMRGAVRPQVPFKADNASLELFSDRTALALRLWDEAQPITGTPGEAYLTRERGLNLVDDVHEVLRWHPAMPFAGTRTSGMIALVRSIVTDAPQAVHRTAIGLDGRKAVVRGKDRLALGGIANGAVKLTADAEVATCLGIGEGIESTLSLRCLPEFGASPVWSVLNAAGIAAFPPLLGIECLWVAVDHDPAGERSANACAGRWRFAGKEVFRVRMNTEGADLNDLVEAHHV